MLLLIVDSPIPGINSNKHNRTDAPLQDPQSSDWPIISVCVILFPRTAVLPMELLCNQQTGYTAYTCLLLL